MSKKAPLFARKYILHDLLKWFMSWKLLLWYRLKLIYDGDEAKKKIKCGAIIVCNHIGFADPFIIQCAVPYRRFYFLVAKEMFSNAWSSFWYKKVFLSEPVDREKPSLATMKYCAEVANRGNIMCLFPEGHIVREDDKIDAFKGGAVLMAYMANAPIIPFYRERRKSVFRMTRMVVGKPINVKEIIGPVPTQNKIQEVSRMLSEYEQKLMEINELDKNKRKHQ